MTREIMMYCFQQKTILMSFITAVLSTRSETVKTRMSLRKLFLVKEIAWYSNLPIRSTSGGMLSNTIAPLHTTASIIVLLTLQDYAGEPARLPADVPIRVLTNKITY